MDSRTIPHHRVSGSGPWVVLIHSLATSGSAWDVHAQWLARDHRVLQYDVLGHGRSAPAAPDCTLATLADELEHLLHHLDVQQAHVVGLSMGGMIAQLHAILHPARVRSLTLIATTGLNAAPARQAWDERIALARRQGMQALVEPMLQRWFTPAFRARDEPVLGKIAALIAAMDVDSFAAVAAAVRDVDTLAALSRVRVPALVIAGAQDPATPPAVVTLVAAAIPTARFVVLPEAAHWLALEQPDSFRAELTAFVRAVES